MEKPQVTFAGKPVTLEGNFPEIGQKAPDFTGLTRDLEAVSLSDFQGKTVIVSVVPSLDTPVCELQTRTFNERAAKLEDTAVITVSCDLPFAQERFCAAKDIDAVTLISDHKDLDFGQKYGMILKEFRLLTRGILIIDREGILRYREIVPEVTDQVDFDRALEEAKKLK